MTFGVRHRDVDVDVIYAELKGRLRRLCACDGGATQNAEEDTALYCGHLAYGVTVITVSVAAAG